MLKLGRYQPLKIQSSHLKGASQAECPNARPLFGPSGPGYKKTAVSIEFKYHPFQKVSYRIKRVLIQILSGHVLKLILTGIFYGFLNIYKILRILREQNIVKFQRPKITSDT